MNQKRPEGSLKRGVRIGKLGLSLTGSYLGYQFQNLFLDSNRRAERRKEQNGQAARRIREELEDLKGPLMKIGQIFSMQSQALPVEALQELSKLQMQAPGMHPTLARAQFKSSLGKYPEEIFREFEPEPFAAASLGQVHRAITREGETVAVKIQYPAIRSAIENDFKLFRSLTLPGRVTGYFPESILAEVQRGFLEEVDYIGEAANLDFLREKLACFPWLSIPRVHRALTTERVLTMSYIEGDLLRDFLIRQPSSAVRDRIGARLLELYYFQVFHVQAIHADPHPGNYLFQKDGRIGLVDFGCVKRLSPDIPELARCCFERIWRQGQPQMDRMACLIWGPGQSCKKKRVRDLLHAIIAYFETVFPSPEANQPLVDFGDAQVLQRLTENLSKALRYKLTNPEFAFCGRAELGLFNLLHQLQARVHTVEVLQGLAQPVGTKVGRK